MSENLKTGLFVGTAILLAVVAFSTKPVVNSDSKLGLGEQLFPEFTDSFGVHEVRIVEFDEAQGESKGITVEKNESGWVIASQHGYPADAQDQLEKAVGLLSGLTKLSVESSDEGDHEKYGVKDPTQAESGDKGVGRLVRLAGADDKILAELIIGKRFELGSTEQDSAPGDLRYVRVPGQPTIFTTRLQNPSALKSAFEDWVERDLLTVKGGYSFSSGNVSRISLDKHKVEQGPVGAELSQGPVYRFDRGEGDDEKWLNAESSELKLALHEALDIEEIDGLSTAFGDLEITGVQPKPVTLATNLLSGNEFLGIPDEESLALMGRSLRDKGFYAVPVSRGENTEPRIEIFSNQGEMRAGMEDGVEYVMRFGAAFQQNQSSGGHSENVDENDSRYVYILSRFNSNLLDKPVIKPPPTPPADLDTNATAKSNLEKLQAEIDEHNQKALEEYETKASTARQRVAGLNAKYAKWYYVISEDTFNKLQVGRAALVTDKEIHASHILVAYKEAEGADEKLERTKEEAQVRAQELLKQVEAEGADFSKIAEKESDDSSALSGGSLGTITFSKISKDFGAALAAAVFELEEKETSKVIEGPSGFHIIRRTPPPPKPDATPPHGGGPPPGLFPPGN